MLRALPSRDADEADLKRFQVEDSDALLRDFEQFRQDLKDEGFYDPDYLHIISRILELVIMHAIGMYLILQNYDSNIPRTALGILILGIAQGRCGWFMHEGGHCSLTGNIKIDWHIQRFFYGYGCGMSGRWWRIQHNKHHATPQKLSHDPDLNTLPLVAFCESVGKTASGYLQKKWIGVQNLLF